MLTGEQILANAIALAPFIRERSHQIEVLRRLPLDVVQELKRAGVFRMPMPAAWGGPEMGFVDQLRVIEVLSHADPSVGWCVMIGSDSGFYSSFFDDATGREIWPDLDMVTAGWQFPGGQARVVDGGYVASGRWSFGSGCTHADVIVGACLVVDDQGALVMADGGMPRVRVIVAPASSFEIIDNWHTTGLAGSGSNDYSCTELFVPEAHTFHVTDPVQRPGALYALPGAFFANTHGVPLGLARRALDEVEAIAQTKMVLPQFAPMRDVPRVKEAIASAETSFRSARAYAYDSLERAERELAEHGGPTESTRIDLVLSRVQCFTMAKDVALAMVALAGTQAIRSTSVLDRLARDAITMATHIVAGPMMSELAGGMALGVPPTGPYAALF